MTRGLCSSGNPAGNGCEMCEYRSATSQPSSGSEDRVYPLRRHRNCSDMHDQMRDRIARSRSQRNVLAAKEQGSGRQPIGRLVCPSRHFSSASHLGPEGAICNQVSTKIIGAPVRPSKYRQRLSYYYQESNDALLSLAQPLGGNTFLPLLTPGQTVGHACMITVCQLVLPSMRNTDAPQCRVSSQAACKQGSCGRPVVLPQLRGLVPIV